MTTVEHILQDLNEPQREAVSSTVGPLLILAGPGSGKTRVITHRIAYLVQVRKVPPWRIAAVTFTNKAAREMRGRVEAHLGGEAADLVLGTFHAICARWLRVDGQRAGIDRSFSIFDDTDQMALMKRVAEALHIDTRRIRERSILSAISHAKSELVTPYDYAAAARDYFGEVVARAYERYEQMLAESNALDFDDLIVKVVHMLRDNEEVREKYQERFLHVLVDEFQDTNIAQYQLARLLARKHGNICVVGDPDQSIYSWRSADIRNILNFERDFPSTKIVLLEQNYRSTQTILDAAHAVIAGSKERPEKSLWTDSGHGEPIVMFEAYDEGDEAEFVANEISGGVDGGRTYADYAVMYRTNAQSRALEEAFIRRNLPYQLVGGTRFYERREVRDVLAYMRLINNPYDVVSFTRVVNVPGRGVGAKSLEQLGRWAERLGVPVYTALQVLAAQQSGNAGADIAGKEKHPLGSRQARALQEFVALLGELIDVAQKNTLTVLIHGLLERIGYRRFLLEEYEDEEESFERWANVEELVNVASDYDALAPGHGLVSFLEDVALIADADTIQEPGEGRGKVTLITLHSAKGLEYPVVFMTAMEEGVLPHMRSFDDPAQMEEERRLCYVGMTRAKERLYLLRAFRRYGHGGSQHNPPSRFLRDVPQALVMQQSPLSQAPAERGERRYQQPPQRDDRPLVPDEAMFSGGEKVRHPRFGEGVVVGCVVKGDDQEVTVAFKGEPGIKKLMLSFAPLERL